MVDPALACLRCFRACFVCAYACAWENERNLTTAVRNEIREFLRIPEEKQRFLGAPQEKLRFLDFLSKIEKILQAHEDKPNPKGLL